MMYQTSLETQSAGRVCAMTEYNPDPAGTRS